MCDNCGYCNRHDGCIWEVLQEEPSKCLALEVEDADSGDSDMCNLFNLCTL